MRVVNGPLTLLVLALVLLVGPGCDAAAAQEVAVTAAVEPAEADPGEQITYQIEVSTSGNVQLHYRGEDRPKFSSAVLTSRVTSGLSRPRSRNPASTWCTFA